MPASERKSILCPNCRKLINRDEPFCPYCGLSNPGAPWKRGLTAGAMFADPYSFINIIVAVNVVFFVFSLLISFSSLGLSANPFTFLSPSTNSLILLGATGTIPIEQLNRWWTLISATYLHGGILHILFNMLALKQLAPLVIGEYGLNRFFIIYTVTGAAGFLLSYLVGIPLTIGASASICGLIGATLYYGKSRGGFYGEAIYKQVMGWVIGLAVFGFMIPGINNWGHGGGILAGIALGFLLGYNENRPEAQLHKTLSAGCIILTVGVLLWALIQSIYYMLLS